ncbi:MAG: uridine phosphorylase [Deltaproteobacteria bacterium]|nr:uridine phosphorylase [Deltaproteobacteria bacterium]
MRDSRENFVKRFFDPSRAILEPQFLVRSFTGKPEHELVLPERAIITFNNGDLRRLAEKEHISIVTAWQPFRTIYVLSASTVAVNSFFGGPNIAALVEELSSFGAREFILWGYCGGMSGSSRIGSLYIAGRALREEGISYHYLEDDNEFVSSDWAKEWSGVAEHEGFQCVDVWSTDAIYRETNQKIADYARRGIAAVEMETASLYAVCQAKGLKAAAFLVVSDLVNKGTWQGGFHTRPFKEGVRSMARFMTEKAIL